MYSGLGDGNGLIEGNDNPGGAPFTCGYGICISCGEPVLFWNDLSYANGLNLNLIEGSFNAATSPNAVLGALGFPNGSAPTGATLLPYYFPQAKLGGGNFIYVWSIGGANYFGLSAVISISNGQLYSNVGLTVRQAYDIDKKVDDGLPQSGNVLAMYTNFNIGPPEWAAGGATGSNGAQTGNPSYYAGQFYQLATTAPTTGSSTTCYDNGGVTAPQNYSLEISNGGYVNCALSFKMQAGD